ncbi:MAG TPA: (d)CMP kinase [Chthonomonadaceae bacterium]|nr:(d)CMP kinase [Chthonomonadaceae bacterium]
MEETTAKPFIVAIDGPAGAGKSTVARQVAAALGLTYLDTGAMYRAVAWKALRAGVDTTDEAALADLAQQTEIAFSPVVPDGTQRVWVDGEDVTTEIRAPAVSNLTSAISTLPAVRRVLVAQQRQIGLGSPKGVVVEGRDTGTVVFPQAQVKVFLTASPEERARRRAAELEQLGLPVDYARILADQRERDERDSRRAASPLVAAPDAARLDTDRLTVDEAVARILSLCREKRTG